MCDMNSISVETISASSNGTVHLAGELSWRGLNGIRVMKKATERDHLRKAEADIAEAQDRIAKQRALIVKLREDGHDTRTAEKLLHTMLQSLEAMEGHRIVILEMLGLYGPGESEAAPEIRSKHRDER